MGSHIQLEQTWHGYIQFHPGWSWKPCGHSKGLLCPQGYTAFESGYPIILFYSFIAIIMKDKKIGDQGCQILKELIHTVKSATPEPKTGLSSFTLPALMIFSTKILSEDNIFILI